MEEDRVRRISQASDLSKPGSQQRHSLGISSLIAVVRAYSDDDGVPDTGHLFSHPG